MRFFADVESKVLCKTQNNCKLVFGEAWIASVVLSVFVIMFTCAVKAAHAQSLPCPKSLSWKDATRLQRSSVQGTVTTRTEWKKYSNATTAERQVDGVKMQLIDLGKGTYLTFGNPRPSPKDFDQFLNSVASPMWESDTASLPRFATPCVLKSNESVPFNEKDFIYWKNAVAQSDMKIFGSLKRQGSTVVYAMEIQRGTGSDQLSSLFGTWEYQANLDALPDTHAVHGWHLFRDAEFVETIPSTSKLTLGELLSRFTK